MLCSILFSGLALASPTQVSPVNLRLAEQPSSARTETGGTLSTGGDPTADVLKFEAAETPLGPIPSKLAGATCSVPTGDGVKRMRTSAILTLLENARNCRLCRNGPDYNDRTRSDTRSVYHWPVGSPRSLIRTVPDLLVYHICEVDGMR